MGLTASNKKCPGTGFFSRLKNSFSAAERPGWLHTNKLRIISICLAFVIVFAGYEAVYEYAKLQQADNAKSELIKSYSQSVVILSRRYTDINKALAATNSTLAAGDSDSAAALLQLSPSAVSGNVSEFASYADLVAWLKQDDTHQQVYSTTFQCVDFAEMMSEHAIKDGYWIFPAVDLADGHMQCIAPIGDNLYAIEPQTNAVSLWAAKSTP
jgi:hypothetical protein